MRLVETATTTTPTHWRDVPAQCPHTQCPHLATQCPPCHTCELGRLSNHIPLLMTLPTSTLKKRLHIPIHYNPTPESCPREVLNCPVDDSDWLTIMQSLHDPAYASAYALFSLKTPAETNGRVERMLGAGNLHFLCVNACALKPLEYNWLCGAI